MFWRSCWDTQPSHGGLFDRRALFSAGAIYSFSPAAPSLRGSCSSVQHQQAYVKINPSGDRPFRVSSGVIWRHLASSAPSIFSRCAFARVESPEFRDWARAEVSGMRGCSLLIRIPQQPETRSSHRRNGETRDSFRASSPSERTGDESGPSTNATVPPPTGVL